MQTLKAKSQDLSRREEQPAESDKTTSSIVRVQGVSILTPEEDRELMERLSALEAMPESEIDLSESPEWTAEKFRNAVGGPWSARAPHTVTLSLDAEVVEWLEMAAKTDGYLINLVLKREAQRAKRLRAASKLDKAS